MADFHRICSISYPRSKKLSHDHTDLLAISSASFLLDWQWVTHTARQQLSPTRNYYFRQIHSASELPHKICSLEQTRLAIIASSLDWQWVISSCPHSLIFRCLWSSLQDAHNNGIYQLLIYGGSVPPSPAVQPQLYCQLLLTLNKSPR